MSESGRYPASIVTEGPVFSDELAIPSSQVPSAVEDHSIEDIYLVPTKSAAKGVYKILFTPSDRQWALVRLARRYRWVLEVQLLRGMSGEQQLLNQGLTGADIDFLRDIIPRPDTEYSTIVYDMLWVTANFREYLYLAEAMQDRDQFTPREIIEEIDSMSLSDAGLFSRFLRSHLIVPVSNEPEVPSGPADKQTINPNVDLDRYYQPTPEGIQSLVGIVKEYDRIFTRQEFKPLLINPELDPKEHLREFEPEQDVASTVPTPELESADGILGEIAGAFSDEITDEETPDAASASSTVESTTDDVQQPNSTESPTRPSDNTTEKPPKTVMNPKESTSGSTSGINAETQNPLERNEMEEPARPTKIVEGSKAESNDPPENTFSDTEVLTGVNAGVEYIQSENVVHTKDLKNRVWDACELGDRNQGEYWELVCGVLYEMDVVQGRPDGRIWMSAEFSEGS